ncbi:pre-peptidase C-terminal domain-containing protein [Plectonema cf. radiosum LEGE 06105]|uniref:Pre-peptidase C-terminal domain-containing protein n=1 Tax=Plectonema cf. radiosum LEGE 06105 TaxID=945769 RepID=A0A8J7K1B5_9CYAN|nr:C2 family cysteine protease [Plectonema radiosum]MBE9211662.1 pre-peptidase C-terminal domain-containing protein [Plectonema cf. radiosum LEGE 06105]
MQIDNGGNFLGSSTPLDTNQKWQVIKDKVGLDNTDDYYSFKLSSRSSFNLVLSNLSDNADVRLLNDHGSEIANSSGNGNVSEKINQILDSGSYHIHVHQVGNVGTSYNLRVRSNHIPQAFQFNTEAIAGGVRLTDTKVFDADGVNDLRTVDFWLKKQGESWKKFGSVSEFSENTDGSIGFNYDINNLEQGKYHIWGRATDKLGARSNVWTESFNVENIVNLAPQNLGFAIDQITGGIKLTNTKVFDANGIDDLERIDFQLKKEGGEWTDIKDALNFYQNQDASIGFNYSISDLKQGNYELKAIAYDKAGASGDALTTYFKVANVAPSNFEFDIQTIEGGVRVINGKVFDANGIDDLSRVDFWLQKQGGNWQNIADAVEFRSNEDGSFGFDYSIDSLEGGDYLLWARTRDKIDDYSNIWQKSFQVVDTVPQQDWFDQNIQDTNIRELSRSLFSDNIIDRNEAIAIIRNAKDDGVVDSTELNDLRTIINNASYLGMSDYVRVLSNKVVNGDVANKSGNLQAGSSDVQLDKLINKWFLGSERPITTHTYQYAQGSLFQNGISHDDIKQGYINDCFFLAGLGATAVQSPEIIQNMFIDNGDGTFTVRFYNKGVADYVTVDRYLPTNNIGNFVYANAGDYHGNSNNELWVALAEKAYAQLNESGWINQDNTNSYNGIGNAGYLSDAFAHITGEKSALGRILNFNTVIDAFSSGEVVGFGSKSSGVESNIVTSHAYALIDYNATTQKFTLLNPWSTDNTALKSRTLELSWNEISNNFSYWDSTIKNVVST